MIILYGLLGLAFFAVSAGLVSLCERLRESGQ